MTALDSLIGETIDDIRITNDQTQLAVRTSAGALLRFVTQGDCCSESWWSDILGFEALKGGTVRAINERRITCIQDGRSRQECDSLYGYMIETDQGSADIAFRNSSNGYYGGDAYAVPCTEEQFAAMQPVTGDWSA